MRTSIRRCSHQLPIPYSLPVLMTSYPIHPSTTPHPLLASSTTNPPRPLTLHPAASTFTFPQRRFSSSSSPSTEVVDHPEDELHHPHPSLSDSAHIRSMEHYRQLYQRSVGDPQRFWEDMAKQHLHFFSPFTTTYSGDLHTGNISWYQGGTLNAAYNCIDRHLPQRGDKIAILWEGDDPTHIRSFTYQQLHDAVNRLANGLKELGVGKGSHVCIYLPMIPEAAIAMLACARLGAVHSVVFAGFSEDALRDRIVDGHCTTIITADQGRRGGKKISLKPVVDRAVANMPQGDPNVKPVTNIVVIQNTTKDPSLAPPASSPSAAMIKGRDVWYHDLIAPQPTTCQSAIMAASDSLFMLYTSGSTGKPKGIVHSTAAYLTYVTVTAKYVFDIHDTDRYACVADIGWITGHSYIVYGPLALGATSFMFEGIPTYPSVDRYWAMIERHRLSVFYTSPTAVRTLMKSGEEPVCSHDLSSLRILGSVGEPINPEAWRWLYHVVGNARCSIVDTYWQTETGGIIMTPLPGATPQKPGSCTLPFFGITPVLLDDAGHELQGNDVTGLLAIKHPWPGLAATIYNDHSRYLQTYLHQHPGYYVTGDGARRDRDGYYWVTGRVDDVINVSGHRIGSAEVESALVLHPAVSEAAVIGMPHETKGSGLFCFVIGKAGVEGREGLVQELREVIRANIGPFASPEYVLITQDVPKTRSGKIMRRLLRKIAEGEKELGDISTLADPDVVKRLQKQVNRLKEGNGQQEQKKAKL